MTIGAKKIKIHTVKNQEWKMIEGGVCCIAKDVYGRKGGTDYEKDGRGGPW
jgi:hypothetical protein